MSKNFNTLMLLKCVTKQKYAKDFLEYGKLKFGKPQEWIDAWEKEGSGRGDLLEGSFASIISKNDEKAKFYKLFRNNVIDIVDQRNGNIHFYSKDVLDLPTCCFFGLNDNMFKTMSKGEDGNEYPSGKIKKSYFRDFAKSIDKSDYENYPEDEKPALIMINNPKEFRKRLETYFINNGVELSEIIYRPVEYVDKFKEFNIPYPAPYELFTKDNKFSNQSEIRLVVNTKNEKFLKKLNESKGIVELGNMRDIASIEEYYFEDFIMQKRGNRLVYILATPKIKELSENTTDFFNKIEKTDTVTESQTINGKEYPLIVERDEKTGAIKSIHP